MNMASNSIKMLLSLKKDVKEECFVGMLADYCWFIKRDTSELLNK